MPGRHAALIAAELSLSQVRVRAVATLLEDGTTIPFNARYRKGVAAQRGVDVRVMVRAWILDRLHREAQTT